MDQNFNISNNIEKVVEENPLLILLESKVIIKNKRERIGINLSQISNVRLIKNRNLTLSVLVLVHFILFYFLVLSPMKFHFAFSLMFITILSILFVISFFIKNYTYKLLINQGKFGFNEITISKTNSIHAENFVSKFKNTYSTNMSNAELDFQKLKECL